MIKEYVPAGWKIEGGHVTNQETGRFFLLTNRSFESINDSFAGIPGKIVEELKKRKSGLAEPIRILDVGGGTESRASGDLAEKEHSQNIQVFSIDLIVRKNDQRGLHQIAGDMLKLPLQGDTIDMAYSRMSISFMEQTEPEIFFEALREIARVLKPGGIFLVDKLFTKRLEGSDKLRSLEKRINPLKNELGVAFYSKEVDSYWEFIIIVKEPINDELLKKLRLNKL